MSQKVINRAMDRDGILFGAHVIRPQNVNKSRNKASCYIKSPEKIFNKKGHKWCLSYPIKPKFLLGNTKSILTKEQVKGTWRPLLTTKVNVQT